MQLPITKVGDRIEVQMLEDLVDLSLHEIHGPVGLINLSQPNSENEESDKDLNTNWPEGQVNPSHPETSKSESSCSKEENMVDKNVDDNRMPINSHGYYMIP